MSVFHRGWEKRVALGFFTKEATYGTISDLTLENNTIGCSMIGFEDTMNNDDEVISDKDDVGREHGTDQEIFNYKTEYTYTESKGRPNSLAGLAAITLGAKTTTAGTEAGYIHTFAPLSTAHDLPSISMSRRFGGVRQNYGGMTGNSLKIGGEAGQPINLEAVLMGKGRRSFSDATTFPPAVQESWLKAYQTKIWLESGTAIDISGAPIQEEQSISDGTPDSLCLYLNSFEWTFNNNLEGTIGFGSIDNQRVDFIKRSVELSFELKFRNQADIELFRNQTAMAIEIDCAGDFIDGDSGTKYGFKLIVPRFKLRSEPQGEGGVGDFVTATFDCEVFEDDDDNPVSKLIVYNDIDAYLA